MEGKILTSTATYVVELSRWGIKNDGTDPVNTVNGINNAFLWARDNNFYTVVLPKGQYLVDKNSSVKLCSNTNYKFYDCLFIKEPNNLTSYSILLCDGIKNVTIEGATVKGDRETHDYSSGGSHEWGHGIECKNSCYNITIKNCEAYECTGDGFVTSMDFSAIGGAQHPGHFAKGDIDSKGNIDSTQSDYTTVSKFFDVTGNLVKSVGYFYYSGDGYGGYGIGSNLNKTIIKVHFYRADNTYLGFRNTRSYEFIYLDSLPVGTAKVRFSFLQNFDLMSGNLHYVMCAKIPQYIYFINCKSHKNRRLGASINGGRFITFEGCEIYNNSNPMSNSRGTNPGYGIDVEDGYMANQKIILRNCNLYDNRAGAFVCISTRGVHVENNKIRGSFVFSGSGDDYLSLNNMYYGAINGRSITSGNERDGTFCTFRNDSIFGEAFSFVGGNTILENCVFSKSSVHFGGETTKIINCKFTFDEPGKIDASSFGSKFMEVHDSLFDIRRCNRWVNAWNTSEKVLLQNVKFYTNDNGGGNLLNTKNLVIDNCEFIHSGSKTNYTLIVATDTMRVENTVIKNLSLRFDGGGLSGSTEVLAADNGYITHCFKNNIIIWDAPYGTAVHEARGPGISFSYIPRLKIINNAFHVLDQGVALGSMYTLRVFTENFLNLSDNIIVTTNNSGNNTKGTMTIDGAYRKNSSNLPIPDTKLINQNNEKINSEIVFTSKLNSQL